MHKVFVYGTLTSDADILLRHPVNYIDHAILHEYRRIKCQYYFAIPCDRYSVHGRIIANATDEDLMVLDAYERVDAGLYQRVRESAVVGSRYIDCWVYIAGRMILDG